MRDIGQATAAVLLDIVIFLGSDLLRCRSWCPRLGVVSRVRDI
jgi:hypothetical protein